MADSNGMDGERLAGAVVRPGEPTLLYARGERAIYWLGIAEETAFRCNTYLLRDGEEAILVDPGGRLHFQQVRESVSRILPPERVTGMVLCHQDPDVAASMIEWLELNPDMRVFSSARTHVLLPHYGRADYHAYDTDEAPFFSLPTGSRLRFIPAPFLHFPGAFTTWDEDSGFLFSGDIWAALDLDWSLMVSSFERHVPKMDLFHLDYMCSNLAARGFVRRLEGLAIRAILPQHGSLIGPAHVGEALKYLASLRCGLDIIYADLASE